MKEIVSVIVVAIENPEGKILLLKRAPHKKLAPNLWNIVSGHIEENEEPLAAAVREIGEETGLSVELAKEYPMYDVDYDGKIWRTWAFRFSTPHKEPTLNEEHSEFMWVDSSDIPSFEVIPIILEDLRQMKYIE